MLALVLAALLVNPAAAPAPGASDRADTPQVEQTQNADDRVICRRERVLGSNRPQRICMTQREWNGIRESSQDTMRQMERGSPQALPDGI